MIDSKRLLADLQKLLKVLEADIAARLQSQPDKLAQLNAEWQAARDANRTAATRFDWQAELVTQAAVHWILASVFLRFLEDNGFLARPFLFGADADTQALARDRHETYFRQHPALSDREYLLECFAEAARLPGLAGLFDPAHNPLYRLEISGDGAMALLGFWRKIDPDSGRVIHDFADPAHGTRFLGDLYQDLSAAAKKRYALLQTPEFVQDFILDRTLTPAIDTFGYRVVRLIDPTCGSGHFLLGAFSRLFALWVRHEPGRNAADLAQKALDAIHGVDLNPFAVEIARFRLLIAALDASGVTRLADAPDFRFNLAVGDSLLHGARFGLRASEGMFEDAAAYADTPLAHAYAVEDAAMLNRILGRQYHAVVGNPPYITVKDAALNAAYRRRYASCHMKYSLGVPFTERFFDLALTGTDRQPAGYVGLITTNSFMKREFGAKLVEEYLPTVDLTHVIDTSGAYIPGHGTPTVILFGRHRGPVGETVRTVMGIKGEPATPADPAQGLVWRAIVGQVDRAGSESAFVSVVDTPRETFNTHPWSIGGGGASNLLDFLDEVREGVIRDHAEVYGGTGRTSADDAMTAPMRAFARRGVERALYLPLVEGDQVRDWIVQGGEAILSPYSDGALVEIRDLPGLLKWLWRVRTLLGNRVTFGKTTYFAEGRAWWEWHQITPARLRYQHAIPFAEVATHNHFVLDRGGKVFKQTAPVIKLPADADEDAHLGLLGLLNSSVACFWLKQVCQSKGGGGINEGHRGDLWEFFFQFNSTKVAEFPLTGARPLDLARRLDALARQLTDTLPDALLAREVPTRAALDAARDQAARLRAQMIALQEELDWRCYRLYRLIDAPLETASPPELALGERAFEIALARRMAEGEEETTWFERHGSTPITELPAHWPADYRRLVERRIALIESDRTIGLIERPEYKRRWNAEPWAEQERRALKHWLLGRLETERYWPRAGTPRLRSVHELADLARTDADFMQVAALYAGRDDFDVGRLVAELLEAESVPFLPVLRYTETGLAKRAEWEATWALQRREDAIDAEIEATLPARRARLEAAARDDGKPLDAAQRAWVETKLKDEVAAEARRRKAAEVGSIPVPPKYKAADFQKNDFWRLRGALDVPKERFVAYPGASFDADGSLVVAWAGYDHLQQATALANRYLELKDNHGWPPERLAPLLAGLLELVPWLKQWHNDLDPEHGARMGEYFEGFVQDEARALGTTVEALRGWRPQAAGPRRGRRRAA